MKSPRFVLIALATTVLFFQCKPSTNTEPQKQKKGIPQKQRKAAPAFTYTLDTTKKWFAKNDSSLSDQQRDVLMAVNRTDNENLKRLPKLLVPSDMSGDIDYYTNFPLSVPSLADVNKILIFSYATQTFAAYANGELVYSGPTNMGRKKDPTPEGLYFTNWKAEQTTSTFNDEWDLKWNFNIENKEGIGFHQYALPGYPASHSCLRLREKDAKYLYTWAEQWELKGSDDILAKGTPVVVFGSYPFDGEKPWLKLATDPKALDMSVKDIDNVTGKYVENILAEQKKREDYMATKK
jgi:lipoprotein-anchoring transpeptidase ErfK/SrfK